MTEIKDHSKNLNVCMCGCGQLVTYNKYRPRKYINGHNTKGSKNINWKGGRLKHNGYWLVLKPDHLFSNFHGYVREHRLVYEAYYNCCLLPYVDIHHINGNTLDNRIENLQPIYRGPHMILEKTKDKSKWFCLICKEKTWINKYGREYWYNYNNGHICHRCYRKIHYD